MDETEFERLMDEVERFSEENLPPSLHAYFHQEQGASGDSENDGSRRTLVDPGLAERYAMLKREFVKSKAQQGFLEKVAGGITAVPDGYDPEASAREGAQRSEKNQEILSRVLAKFNDLQVNARLAKERYSTLKAEKQELLERAAEFRRAQAERLARDDVAGGESSSWAFGTSDDDDDVNMDELNGEGERLMAAQQRKAELLVKIEAVKRKNLRLANMLGGQRENLPPELRHLVDQPPNDTDKAAIEKSLCDLKTHNAELESKIAQHREMADFYTGMRECAEEVRGVRVLRIDNSPPAATSATSESRFATRAQPLRLLLLLLSEYELEIDLQPVETLVSERVRAQLGDSSRGQRPSQLVPVRAAFRNFDLDLDDLVVKAPLSAAELHMYPNDADRLRRLVIEALARIHARSELEQQLERLPLLPGVEFLGSERENSAEEDNLVDSRWWLRIEGGNDPSLGWIAVLRLTPDCPLFRGSVSLDELFLGNNVETAASDASLVAVCTRVNQESFSAPCDLVQHLLEQLRGSEGS